MYRILARPTSFTHYPQRLAKPNRMPFIRPQEQYLVSRSTQQIHLIQKGDRLFIVASSIALLILSQQAQSAEEKILEKLDQLEELAKTLGISLPKQEESETFVSWSKRCEQFCFQQVLEACAHQPLVIDRLDKQLLNQLTDQHGRSLLLAAAQEANLTVVQTLLTKKIALNRKDLNGNTPLHLAVEIGRTDLIPLLKDYIDLPNTEKETALHVAIRCGHDYLIPPLIQLGSKPDYSCRYKNLELDTLGLAVATGHTACLDRFG